MSFCFLSPRFPSRQRKSSVGISFILNYLAPPLLSTSQKGYRFPPLQQCGSTANGRGAQRPDTAPRAKVTRSRTLRGSSAGGGGGRGAGGRRALACLVGIARVRDGLGGDAGAIGAVRVVLVGRKGLVGQGDVGALCGFQSVGRV